MKEKMNFTEQIEKYNKVIEELSEHDFEKEIRINEGDIRTVSREVENIKARIAGLEKNLEYFKQLPNAFEFPEEIQQQEDRIRETQEYLNAKQNKLDTLNKQQEEVKNKQQKGENIVDEVSKEAKEKTEEKNKKLKNGIPDLEDKITKLEKRKEQYGLEIKDKEGNTTIRLTKEEKIACENIDKDIDDIKKNIENINKEVALNNKELRNFLIVIRNANRDNKKIEVEKEQKENKSVDKNIKENPKKTNSLGGKETEKSTPTEEELAWKEYEEQQKQNEREVTPEEKEAVKPGQTESKKELTNDNNGEAKNEGASKDNNTARNTTSTNLEEIIKDVNKDLENLGEKKPENMTPHPKPGAEINTHTTSKEAKPEPTLIDIKEEVDLAREQLKELFKARGIEDYENTDLYKDLILKIDVAEMAYIRAGEVIKSNVDENFKKAYKTMQEVNKDYLGLTPEEKLQSYFQERLDVCKGLEKDPDRIKNLDKAMNNILVLKMRDILRPKQEEQYSEIIEESKKVVEEEQIKKISNENSLPAKVESKGIWNKLRNWNNSRKMYATLKKGIKDYDKKVKECDKEVKECDKKVKECDKEVKECDKDSIINTPNDIKDTILGSMLLSKRQKEKLVHMIEHKYLKKEGKMSPETVNTIKSMVEEKKASQEKTFKAGIKDPKASEKVVKVGQEHSNDDREKAEENKPSKDGKSTFEDVLSK